MRDYGRIIIDLGKVACVTQDIDGILITLDGGGEIDYTGSDWREVHCRLAADLMAINHNPFCGAMSEWELKSSAKDEVGR